MRDWHARRRSCNRHDALVLHDWSRQRRCGGIRRPVRHLHHAVHHHRAHLLMHRCHLGDDRSNPIDFLGPCGGVHLCHELIESVLLGLHIGHHRLTIDPVTENTRAIAAYSKLGFRPVGILRSYQRMADGHWADALLMDLLAPELVR